ncbi:hypothetical protein G6M89_04705 [Natronolimnobius sp. AArcel1]|uniref:DUF7289 family protein n=1 Tax=Natronolimnobius sp. AArcel1 TaxID=1679093 RepID=UPI0013E9F9A6|nr:hypothetical protein [Natronolimnobius sp. AArcel1]NGM68315.1 hypothetical protein [Natronolimnobius sp. AArcel1]
MTSGINRVRHRSGSDTDRSVNPVVGVVLLIGIVLIGSALLFVTGSTVLDSVESEADREQVQFCIDETDHRLGTVASTGHGQAMDFDESDCQPQLADSGTVLVTWYDDGEQPTWDASSSDTAETTLGALEFNVDGQTIAHQGGGVWDLSDSSVSIEKPPAIGFETDADDGQLNLDFMQFETAMESGSTAMAERNSTTAMNLHDELSYVTKNQAGDNFALRMESKYADGWERHFKDEAENVDSWSVDIDRGDEYVDVLIEGMDATSVDEHIVIEENNGLNEPNGDLIDQNLLEENQNFHINATLENVGREAGDAETTVTIWDDDGTEIVTQSPTAELDADESIALHEQNDWENNNNENQFNPTQIGLSPGTAYEYNIETPNDTLTENETFYYLSDEPTYTIDTVWSDSSGDETEINADVRNIGTTDGNEETIELEITRAGGSDSITVDGEIELGATESGIVTWTIDESDWPNGTYDGTVTTDDDAEDVTKLFEVTDGGTFEIEDDRGIPDTLQVNGTDGQVITDEDPVTIGANITNTYDSTQTQNVTLDVLDGDGNTIDEDETTLELEANETAQFELNSEQSLPAGEIYEYNVSTEDDHLDDHGSFLVAEEPSEFTIENVELSDEPLVPNDSVTVTADIENQDTTDEQFVWLEGFDDSIVATNETELSPGERTNVELEWGSVDVPDTGDPTMTVGTETDNETIAPDVEPRLEIDDVAATDSVHQGGTVGIDVDLETIGGTPDQEVVLEGFDGEQVSSAQWSEGPGTAEFEYSVPHDAITDRVTVKTDDDDTEGVVVVERWGPDCGHVSQSERDDDGYLLIEDADQLQCIDNAGPHDDHHSQYDSLTDNYRLANDIDAHGTEYWNGGAGFEPIGEQENGGLEFGGDFDGDGHIIEGLHIDRSNEDFVGLFAANSNFHNAGEVGEGSRIHNLRLEDVSVHGQQVTGGLIGAAGGVIEDVRVSGTVEAEYQEVGGIAGSAHNADLDNRLVSEATVRGGIPADATNEVEHPWYADNLGIGGIIGSTGYNTEVSTAYSQADVEGPFGVGGIVGWTSDYASTNKQMYWAEGDITVTASQDEIDDHLEAMRRSSHDDDTGGAIFGRGDDNGDEFDDSVYYNEQNHSHAFGEHVIGDEIHVNERTTDEMQGLDVTDAGNLDHLDYEEEGGPWVALPDDYPRFAWELAAEGQFDVAIDDVADVTAGEAAPVNVTVTSRYQERSDADYTPNETQTISLTDPDGQTVDTQSVTLDSTLEEDETTEEVLVWQTDGDDNGSAEITVRSEDATESAPIDIEPAEHGPGSSDGPGLGPTPSFGDVGDKDDIDLEPGGVGGSSDGPPTPDTDIDVEVDVIDIG